MSTRKSIPGTTQIAAGCAVRRQDFWLWRLFATALSFVLFGLGGVLLRIVVFPAQRLLGGTARVRQRRARLAVYYSFRGLIRFLRTTGVLTVDIEGIERLGAPGQMIIANHPSLLDVALLMAHVKDTNCIIKHDLMRNLFTRGPVTASGYISNDQSLEMFERAADALREGQTLIVFPEGTRTPPGASPRFHRGACAIALRAARRVTPVFIRMTPHALRKGEPWYHVPVRRIHYQITVGQDMDPAEWRTQYPLPIAGRKMHTHWHAVFDATLACPLSPLTAHKTPP